MEMGSKRTCAHTADTIYIQIILQLAVILSMKKSWKPTMDNKIDYNTIFLDGQMFVTRYLKLTS